MKRELNKLKEAPILNEVLKGMKLVSFNHLDAR